MFFSLGKFCNMLAKLTVQANIICRCSMKAVQQQIDVFQVPALCHFLAASYDCTSHQVFVILTDNFLHHLVFLYE